MLNTEKRNPKTMHLESMTTKEIVELINEENSTVAAAVHMALPAIAEACDAVTTAIQNGGRVFYIGAGTSGRLAVCDAAECPPTFGVPYDLFNGIIAGGLDSMIRASENKEDCAELAIQDLTDRNICAKDIVIGISASGSAAYVMGALEYARSIGAVAVAVTNNPGTKMQAIADIGICADTGPEVITGSTRMKAGTAQKIILNMISTTAMIKCGYVYENLMINLKPTNKKLKHRMIGIVQEILHCDEEEAVTRLEKSDWVIREAIK